MGNQKAAKNFFNLFLKKVWIRKKERRYLHPLSEKEVNEGFSEREDKERIKVFDILKMQFGDAQECVSELLRS